jgi:uncharacterized protein DUF4105
MMANSPNKVFKNLLLAMLLVPAYNSVGQTLTSTAEISILTFGPGEKELYSSFGHSAIRVKDPGNAFDAAYNYGTFDFNQPNFYLNFARGYLVYKLAVQDARRLMAYYEYNNRFITEQVLNLTQEQKQLVFDYLQDNARPENANYYYDYFYDNCATKIGDVFVEALGDDFRFNDNFVTEPGLTIRTLTDRYSAEYFPWGKLGIDLCLGLPMDKQLTNMQYTFLPDYVYKAFSFAEIKHGNQWQAVVSTTNNLFKANENTRSRPFITPNLVFWSFWFLVAVVTVLAKRSHFSLRWFDFILFLLIGVLGLLLLLLWLATDHAAAAWNLNLLWAWPTHLVMAFWLWRKNKPRWVNWYLLMTAILGVLLVLCWPVVPQSLNYALIPIVLALATRALGAILD